MRLKKCSPSPARLVRACGGGFVKFNVARRILIDKPARESALYNCVALFRPPASSDAQKADISGERQPAPPRRRGSGSRPHHPTPSRQR